MAYTTNTNWSQLCFINFCSFIR